MTPDDGIELTLDHPTRRLDLARLRRSLARAADEEGFRIRFLGVVLTDRTLVQTLHRDYLHLDEPTDVLSFPLDEDGVAQRVVDGEVYVDLDTAAERAPEFGADFETEAIRYALHGLLHLMGYDDATDAERAAMRAREDLYLARGAAPDFI